MQAVVRPMAREDLDVGRVHRQFEASQLADLRAIGIDWDGEVVRQSERQELYSQALASLDALHTNPYYKYVTQSTKLVLRRVGPTVDNKGLSFCRPRTCQQPVPTT